MDIKTLQKLQTEIENLLEKLEIEFVSPVVESDEEGVLKVELRALKQEDNSDDSSLGILIGPHGETLAAIEYLLALVINQGRDGWLRIQVDVDGYRKKRADELKDLAVRTAEKVRFLNEAVALRPSQPETAKIVG
jgi:predicted RNA-binding protein Jag